MVNQKGKPVICPSCGCEEWEIYSDSFQCFLCHLMFHPKDLLLGKNIYSINQNLYTLYKMNEDYFGEKNGHKNP